MNQRVVVASLTVALAVAAASCGPKSDEKAGSKAAAPSGPASLTELKNLEYRNLGLVDQAKLIDGAASFPGPEGATPSRVNFVRDWKLDADLDGDGISESVVLIGANGGGTGTIVSLAVVAHRNGVWTNVATTNLGDRVELMAASTAGDTLHAIVIGAGANDALCCPGEVAHLAWVFQGDTLRTVPSGIASARLSLATLGDGEWVLTHWDWSEPAPAEPEITLSFRDGRLAGRSACNRYGASPKEGPQPGDLVLGPAISTRMACPDSVMKMESRYLDQFGHAVKYGYMATSLMLTWQKDGKMGTMFYRRKLPAS